MNQSAIETVTITVVSRDGKRETATYRLGEDSDGTFTLQMNPEDLTVDLRLVLTHVSYSLE